MKYLITADTAGWPTSHRPLPYYDLADCFGRLDINFSHDGNIRTYENEMVNVPLFLTELDSFLSRVGPSVSQQWYLGFAPFAYGLLHDGSLLISATKGKDFAGGVYDATAEDDLARLKARVAKDLSRYGKVQMEVGQAGKIASGF